MSAKTKIGIAVGAVLFIVVLCFAIPNPGKKALRREQLAMNEVTSWRILTQVSKNGRPRISRSYAAQCPDKEHILENAEEDFSEYIRIGDDVFYRKNSYQWVQGTPGPDLFVPLPTPRPCLSNPGEPSSRPPGGAEEMRLALENDIKDGNIEKGEKKQYRGSPCQEWTVNRFAGDRLANYITCLSEANNLPLYTRDANEDFHMYFEWGPAVTVEPPDLTPPGKAPTAP
jgi:hypothetical protein